MLRRSQPFAYTALQSHKPTATLGDKIVRTSRLSEYFKHPTYVMSREKYLFTLWIDETFASYAMKFAVPVLAVGAFFKA